MVMLWLSLVLSKSGFRFDGDKMDGGLSDEMVFELIRKSYLLTDK